MKTHYDRLRFFAIFTVIFFVVSIMGFVIVYENVLLAKKQEYNNNLKVLDNGNKALLQNITMYSSQGSARNSIAIKNITLELASIEKDINSLNYGDGFLLSIKVSNLKNLMSGVIGQTGEKDDGEERD